MTVEERYALLKHRAHLLEANGKNIKSTGVIRKIHREMTKLGLIHYGFL